MRQKLTFLFLLINLQVQAQELPTKPANGFAFPIGSKFTIKLTAIDSINYNYSVISFEQFDKIVSTWDNDELFSTEGQDSTIAFYFCLGTHGDNETERKKNMQVLLSMKNYSKLMLKYDSEIQRKENGAFESTSNMGIYPKAKGNEMWPYMIETIGLSTFRKMKP